MMKCFFLVVIMLCQFVSKSQSRFVFNIGIENQLPIQHFRGFYNYGLGTSLNAEYKISDKLSAVLTPEYILYFYSIKSLQVNGTTDFLSLFGGFSYHFVKSIYLVAQPCVSEKLVESSRETAFGYTAGVGMNITDKLTAELKYLNIHANTSAPETINLRVGYNLGKRK